MNGRGNERQRINQTHLIFRTSGNAPPAAVAPFRLDLGLGAHNSLNRALIQCQRSSDTKTIATLPLDVRGVRLAPFQFETGGHFLDV